MKNDDFSVNSPQITIRRLKVPCHLGVPAEERADLQVVLVTLTMALSSIPATDDISGTVDYAAVSTLLKETALERPRQLIETLAQDLGKAVLTNFPVPQVSIEIEKHILPDTEAVSFLLEVANGN